MVQGARFEKNTAYRVSKLKDCDRTLRLENGKIDQMVKISDLIPKENFN